MATPSLVIVPDRYKAGKLYSQIPVDGAGDFTVTRGTTATRVNASGLIESVASGVPRLDYTGGGCPALLVEPAATNLLLYSEEFDDASWTKVGSTISANAIVAPNGTASADKFVADVAAGGKRVGQNVSTGTGDFTASVFAKKAEYRFVFFRLGGFTGNPYVIYNLDTQAVVQRTTGFSTSIQVFENGWYRITGTTNAGAAGTRAFNMAFAPDSGFTLDGSNLLEYTGDGTSGGYFWGAQFETGSVATSYIPTVAATQTRNADVISVSSVSGLIGQTEGTIYAEVDLRNLLGLTTRGILTISDGTSSNRVQISFTSAVSNTIRVIYQGSSTVTFDYLVPSTGMYKIAFAYSSTSSALYVNGSLVLSSGGNSFSASVGNVYLGSIFDGTSALNDRIRAAAIYTSRLSNAELAQLTTL